MKQEYITIISKRMKKKIRIADILYIIKSEYLSLIHLIDGDILQTITPIYELKEMLGDDCIEVIAAGAQLKSIIAIRTTA